MSAREKATKEEGIFSGFHLIKSSVCFLQKRSWCLGDVLKYKSILFGDRGGQQVISAIKKQNHNSFF